VIGGLVRGWNNLRGAGEAAVTVPPLDGALRPNRKLDEAVSRIPLADVDSLAVVSGTLLASSGRAIHALVDRTSWRRTNEYESDIACMATGADDALVIAFTNGEILIEGGRYDGRRYRAAPDARCLTALAGEGASLYVANGSATNPPDAWQRDLLERNASGSLWRIDLDSGASECVQRGLAWPAGLAVDGEALVVSEAWRHRLVRLDAGRRQQVLHADLPGYPGRLAAADGGSWLAVFAPRTQLVEFVLREPAYRRRMVAEVPSPFWIAPKLRSGRSFYEPLQGGGVKHLGLLKPWAPTMSAGLAVKLDAAFQPRLSLHSRADGATHGVTSVIEHRGHVFAAARGDGVVVAIALDDGLGDEG
jgi:hypothetical protein